MEFLQFSEKHAFLVLHIRFVYIKRYHVIFLCCGLKIYCNFLLMFWMPCYILPLTNCDNKAEIDLLFAKLKPVIENIDLVTDDVSMSFSLTITLFSAHAFTLWGRVDGMVSMEKRRAFLGNHPMNWSCLETWRLIGFGGLPEIDTTAARTPRFIQIVLDYAKWEP